ncbi:aldo/keto reductase, diketogulonate reductase [Mycobacteroides abscessus subsp. abscessus]|nr:aldo/keto reductase, diketogulonate reductase [Mycobacteroides abscessus subsp. abscessus]
MEYVDLYLIHWPVKGKYKETWRALEKLYKDGRVRAIGVKIILRWDLQNEVITIPKSVKEHRIIENADIFDFELSSEDMEKIDALNKNERVGADPDNFNF